jgi:putative Ca2+/H+ antiporter (TMEM165/GDT1 family)
MVCMEYKIKNRKILISNDEVKNMLIFFTVLGLVFLAEIGDKTQLVAMAFAAEYDGLKVMLGVLIAVSLLNAIGVALGSYIISIVPLNVIRAVAALMFIGFGLFNLNEGKEEKCNRSFKLCAVATVALTFFIGELGDKTQIMIITMAAQYNSPYEVFAGSVLGMLFADGLGVILGSTVFRKIPQRIVKIISSFIFIFFGTLGLYNAFYPDYTTPLNIIAYFLFLSVCIYIIYRRNFHKTDPKHQ